MKIHVNKSDLLQGLSRVIDACSNKLSMPVLCAVLLQAEESLTLRSESLEMSASTTVKATVPTPGAIALPAKRLQQVIREMPDGVIVIEAKAGRATISAGKARIQMPGFESNDFPEAKPAVEANKVQSTCIALLGMIDSVAYAQSTAPDRPILNGICFEVKDGKLSMKATNGQRLALNSKTVDAKHEVSVILPSTSIPILSKLLGEGMSVSFGLSERGACFSITGETGDTTFHTAVVQGRFVDVSRAIPANHAHKVNVDREALISALRRVSLATDELTSYFRIRASGNVLTLSAASSKHGEAEESIDCTYQGPGMDMHLGIKSLLDPLISMTCETVSIGANNLDQPVVIRNDDPGFTYVCTPVKVL